MSNAVIRKTSEVFQAIHGYEYIAQFLPPCLPMLNPTEECWTEIQKEIRKAPLKKYEITADRIEEVAKTITAENCRG